MNTRILTSAMTILAVTGAVTAGTFAMFSDSASSTQNTFASGDLNLKLDDANESASESVTQSLTGTNMKPGDSTSGFISLHNDGSIDASGVRLAIDTNQTNDGSTPSDMRNVLDITVKEDDAVSDPSCSGGTDLTSAIDNQVGDGAGQLTLVEFDNGGADEYSSLSGLTIGETRNVCFTVTFDTSANNAYQGDAVDTTFTFTADQV